MSLFPTFEEVDKGYCVYTSNRGVRYIGENVYGEPVLSHPRWEEIHVEHGKYQELFTIWIRLDKKLRRESFKLRIGGNDYSYTFNYCEDGYKECIDKLKEILKWYNKSIKRILEEE